MAYISKQIQLKATSLGMDETVHILSPDCNHNMTCDGLELQAQRISSAINDWTLKNFPSETLHLSFISHSLGGIKARLVLPFLDLSRLIPHHFITVATPHLGASFASFLLGSAPSFLVSFVAGAAGLELVLSDSQKLVLRLGTEAAYLDALRLFKTRTAYACVSHDLSVGFETAAIRTDNPCRETSTAVRDVLFSPFNSIPLLNSKSATQPRLLDISEWPIDEKFNVEKDGESHGHVQAMLNGLNSMKWTRIAIFPTRPLLAHVDCIVKNELWNVQFGDSVIQDVVVSGGYTGAFVSSEFTLFTKLDDGDETPPETVDDDEYRRSPPPPPPPTLPYRANLLT
ncbi:putative serine esterase-domain-containing protein [Obelidium mucronatum]|nr:putative serine esterase-domain-containing protein [Obelidium mucronatum]